MRQLIVWYNPNKGIYYHKIVYGFSKKYYVGFQNQYGHEIIYVIDHVDFVEKKPTFKERLIKKLISLLEK